MSIDCACATGLSSRQRVESENSALAMPPCCAHHHGMGHHCKYQDGARKGHPKPCDGTCVHCGQTVMNDTVATASHGASFFPHAFVPILAIKPAGLCASELHLDRSAPTSADLPPPVTAPTLLSLHCALTN